MTSLLPREQDQEREADLTLSTASLLGLFIGLVLICGVFFGFGYSVGRRSTNIVPIATATNSPQSNAPGREVPSPAEAPPVVAENSAVENSPAMDTEKQSAPVTLPVEETPAPSQVASSPKIEPEPSPAATAPTVAAAAPAPVVAAPAPVKAAQKPVQSQQEKIHAMVQVAAVVHQEDANILVAALRQHGFSAVVRTEPQDRLLHVQIGPFFTHADAAAERKKLVSDGYNAYIKQ